MLLRLIIYQLFKLLTKKEGMGFGDFKILAAIGAWGGWQILPFTIFASALLGAVIGIIMMNVRKQKNSHPIPYGPWLAGLHQTGWAPLDRKNRTKIRHANGFNLKM